MRNLIHYSSTVVFLWLIYAILESVLPFTMSDVFRTILYFIFGVLVVGCIDMFMGGEDV